MTPTELQTWKDENIRQLQHNNCSGLYCGYYADSVDMFLNKLNDDLLLWKQMAEEQYGRRQYPSDLELAEGALDATFTKRRME